MLVNRYQSVNYKPCIQLSELDTEKGANSESRSSERLG
jgi:hypothetical protein